MEIHDTENNKMIDISTNERRKQKDINKSISRRKRRNFTDDIKEQQTYITEKIFNKVLNQPVDGVTFLKLFTTSPELQKKLFKSYLIFSDASKASINSIDIISLLRKENIFTLPSSRPIIYINKKVRAEGLLDTRIDINIIIKAVINIAGLPIRSLNRI